MLSEKIKNSTLLGMLWFTAKGGAMCLIGLMLRSVIPRQSANLVINILIDVLQSLGIGKLVFGIFFMVVFILHQFTRWINRRFSGNANCDTDAGERKK